MNESTMPSDALDECVDKLNEITGQFRMPDWEQMSQDEEWQQMLMQDEAYAEWMAIQEAKKAASDKEHHNESV